MLSQFLLAFWVDGEGILRETWTKAATPYVRGTHDLRQRDYVTKVQASSKHLHRRLIDNRWLEFYVQPLISLESSTRSLVVSIPHQVSSPGQTHFHTLGGRYPIGRFFPSQETGLTTRDRLCGY